MSTPKYQTTACILLYYAHVDTPSYHTETPTIDTGNNKNNITQWDEMSPPIDAGRTYPTPTEKVLSLAGKTVIFQGKTVIFQGKTVIFGKRENLCNIHDRSALTHKEMLKKKSLYFLYSK